MASRQFLSILSITFLLATGCASETDEPVATTAEPPPTDAPMPTSTSPSVTPSPTAAPSTTTPEAPPSTTTPPTTTTLGPDERVLAFSDYQLAMASGCIEARAMLAFALETNGAWDDQQADLKATGKTAARDELFSRTEQALVGLVAWVEQLHTEVLGLQPPAGSGPVYASAELSLAEMKDAAETMLNGLRLPASAETVPGTARHLGLQVFEDAASEFDRTAMSTLEVDPALSDWELDIIALRLEVSGMRSEAESINAAWDQDEVVYRQAGALFKAFAQSTVDLVTRVEALQPPWRRSDAHAVLRNTAIAVNQYAQAMLDGLLLPSKDEDVPGTARREALAGFRVAAAAFDEAAAAGLGVPAADWSPLVALPRPHIGPPDVIPPPLAVKKPAHGSGIWASSATISGKTEPGAVVKLGDKTTYADGAGSWSFKPKLKMGHNSITITAVDLAGNKTSIELELHRGYSLGRDRIGAAKMGDLPSDVMPWFIDKFGAPDDEHEVYAEDPYGWHAISYLRMVWWHGSSIFLVFADNSYIRDDGQPGLLFWSTGNDLFVTSRGIHVGATLGEVRAAYGSQINPVTYPECSDIGDFTIYSSFESALIGGVDGPPFNANSEVTYLAGGAPPDC